MMRSPNNNVIMIHHTQINLICKIEEISKKKKKLKKNLKNKSKIDS